MMVSCPPESCTVRAQPYAAMVTSTSTPASMLMMICLTTSVGAFRSMRRLWILPSALAMVSPSLVRYGMQSRLTSSRTCPRSWIPHRKESYG